MAIYATEHCSVPTTRMEALVKELRLLKSGMADMQVRLDAILSEIGVELECEPSADILPFARDDAEAKSIVEETLPLEAAADQAGAEPIILAEPELPAADTSEPVQMLGIDEPAITDVEMPVIEAEAPEIKIETNDVAIATGVEIQDQASLTARLAEVEIADGDVPAEPITETLAIAEADEIETEMAIEPLTLADLPAESLAEIESIETLAIETPAVVALASSVVVLAEHRIAPPKGRSAIGRAGRWAAAIVLIAIAVAVATGTGFAGYGELLSAEEVCAHASEICSIVPGIP